MKVLLKKSYCLIIFNKPSHFNCVYIKITEKNLFKTQNEHQLTDRDSQKSRIEFPQNIWDRQNSSPVGIATY